MNRHRLQWAGLMLALILTGALASLLPPARRAQLWPGAIIVASHLVLTDPGTGLRRSWPLWRREYRDGR